MIVPLMTASFRMSVACCFSMEANLQLMVLLQNLKPGLKLNRRLLLKEMFKQEHVNEDTVIQAILTKKEHVNSSDEESDKEPANIAPLDVTGICSSLIDLQKHGVTAAAEYLEKARHGMFCASRMAQRESASNASQQTLMDSFL